MVQASSRSDEGRGASWRWRRHGTAVLAATALVLLTACGPEDEAATGAPAAPDEASGVVTATPASTPSERASGGSDSATRTATPTKATKATKGKKAAKTRRDKAAGTSTSTPSRKLHRVIRVVDGDTVKVDIDGGESVRIIGIDTPETVHPDKPTECGGQEATAAARALLDGKRVAVVFDASQGRRDRYGRLLAYLDIPQSGDFGEAMLRKGHAKEYTYADPYQRRETYRSAEQQARAAGRGVWGSCTTQQEEPTPTQAPEPKPAPSSPAPTPPAPSAPAPAATAPGPGWTNDALTPGYTGCRQGYPGGKINGVYWWKPIAC